jgi:hypothetical protein
VFTAALRSICHRYKKNKGLHIAFLRAFNAAAGNNNLLQLNTAAAKVKQKNIAAALLFCF